MALSWLRPGHGTEAVLCLVPSARERIWSDLDSTDVEPHPVAPIPPCGLGEHEEQTAPWLRGHPAVRPLDPGALSCKSFMPVVPAWMCTRRPSSPVSCGAG